MAKEYIEREATLSAQNKSMNLDECRKRLERLPTADVVEVVRKPVRGYEGIYEVDNLARVFSIDRVKTVDDNGRVYNKPLAGRQMKQHTHSNGYKVVSLTKDGKTKIFYVHRLVAEAFIENPCNYPMVNHKDEDKTNNLPENLEWCTNSYNTNYGTARNRQRAKLIGKKHTESHKEKISNGLYTHYSNGGDNCRNVICLENDNVYQSIAIAARELGVSESYIGMSCRRQTVKGRRYTFRYYDGAKMEVQDG